MAFLGGLHAHLLQKDIEIKVNLTEQIQDAKKKENKNCANFILIIWPNCMHIAFELQQGLLCVFTNCQT